MLEYNGINYLAYWCKYMGMEIGVYNVSRFKKKHELGDLPESTNKYDPEIMDRIVKESQRKMRTAE